MLHAQLQAAVTPMPWLTKYPLFLPVLMRRPHLVAQARLELEILLPLQPLPQAPGLQVGATTPGSDTA
jgi:hypothetical protein